VKKELRSAISGSAPGALRDEDLVYSVRVGVENPRVALPTGGTDRIHYSLLRLTKVKYLGVQHPWWISVHIVNLTLAALSETLMSHAFLG
jgi:hypothetical protein